MILVGGGQLDPNIGALLRRVLARRIEFCDILVGPKSSPRVTIDLRTAALSIEAREVRPTACFLRHDVFWHQSSGDAAHQTAALNWFFALRGWALACPEVRLFNRHSYLSENNKVENLCIAATFGLNPPITLVTNQVSIDLADQDKWIAKPVAGGDYTTSVQDFLGTARAADQAHPWLVQRRLMRPEMRVYRIGPYLFGFSITSPDLDYRQNQRATIEPSSVPPTIRSSLVGFCDYLGLDFAAADFMRDDAGKLRFLEVNSQPMFVAFDKILGGKLCDAIIDCLVDGWEPIPVSAA